MREVIKADWYLYLAKLVWSYSLFFIVFGCVAFNIYGYNKVINKLNEKKYMEDWHILNDGEVFEISYYTDLKSMTDDSPSVMAWGDNVYEGAIAVSRSMLTKLQHGDCIRLDEQGKGIKTFVVDDKMSKRHNGNKFDIFMEVNKYIYKDMYYQAQWFEEKDKVRGSTFYINKDWFKQMEKDLIYMPLDKCWIRKSDWQKLNTTFTSRVWVKY
ncbi:MAG: hypothetical protein PHH73_00240 [Candidatus Rickettsiella isopodorum]|nr:hypothetical protein [Candidatus Rickettsiella isopodorum]